MVEGFRSGRSPEGRRRYIAQSLERVDAPEVAHYAPRLLGEGGVNAVFESPREGRPDRHVVIKVNRLLVMDLLRRCERTGESVEALTEKEQVLYEKKVARERQTIADLRKYFAADVPSRERRYLVPQEKIYLQQVPLTADLVQALKKPHEVAPSVPTGTHRVWSVLSIQERIPEKVFAEGSVHLRCRYLEWEADARELTGEQTYANTLRRFIDGKEEGDLSWGVRLFGGRALEELCARADTDEELKTLLCDFVARAMRYSKEKGSVLDLVGKDNVRLFKEGNAWQAALLDVRLDGGSFRMAGMAIDGLIMGRPLGRAEKTYLLNVLNYTRLLNAMAMRLGMSERLPLYRRGVATYANRIFHALESIRPGAEDDGVTAAAAK